ncbi:MAG: hypothetical protein AAGF93_08905 [Cyanobacteria bacterium P01_H01_bin.105]
MGGRWAIFALGALGDTENKAAQCAHPEIAQTIAQDSPKIRPAFLGCIYVILKRQKKHLN